MTYSGPSRVGDLRPSQLLWSFGVGAVVDLPNFSAMVLGLSDWDTRYSTPIGEERLLGAVQQMLGPQVKRLLSPPRAPETGGTFDPFSESARIGVPVMSFPEWLRCPFCQLLAPAYGNLFKFEANPFRPDRARFIHESCSRARKPTAVPARFVAACEQGHIDDFPWAYYVHRGQAGCKGILRFFEVGASLETQNLFVKCEECGNQRSMIEAFTPAAQALPRCRGRHPHLRQFDDGCSERLRAILLGASNSWFPETKTVLSVPTREGKLEQVVEDKWVQLQHATSLEVVEFVMKTTGAELAEFSPDEVWEVVQKRNSDEGDESTDSTEVDLKGPEWRVFSQPDPALNGKDFYLTQGVPPPSHSSVISSIGLVERLREVNALVGFTRIRSANESSPMERKRRRGPLSGTTLAWVPATEVRGEGIFLRFYLDRVQKWMTGKAVTDRKGRLFAGHKAWRSARALEPVDEGFPGILYTLIHSLSHVLMREFSLECGYNAASVRERIYASSPDVEVDMAGLLIYTAAPDSEGTLGGLVSLGQPQELDRLMRQALDHATRCASDPLCSEHDPATDRTLHGAACHACMFAPETSCEVGNRYLDRALLVPTYLTSEAALFDTASV